LGNFWLASAVWIGLALTAAMLQRWLAVSIALLEIVVGAVAGNIIDLTATPWIDHLAALGSVLLTFLAGAEIDADVIRRNFAATTSLGAVAFVAPYLGVLAFAHFVMGWPWPQAQIAGLALSTTSVAVVYTVMLETGFNKTELGKILLAACFINNIGTVLALGALFARFDLRLLGFAAAAAAVLLLLPRLARWFFSWAGSRVSEPQIKFVLLVLFALGGLAESVKSQAVLPAYLTGMVLAPLFLRDRELAHRVRVIAFTLFTPFYFLKAGSLVRADVILASLHLIILYLAVEMACKFFGILPLTRFFRFAPREGFYTTFLLSTGLTFGSIAALFGLTNRIIDETQYTILLTAVIGTAVVPTVIAERWCRPALRPLADGEA
jgi:Kef-type K+ transport system membrane component KefB